MGRPRVLNQVEIKAMVEGFFIFVFLSPPLIYRLPFFVLVKLILKSHCLTDGSHTVPLIGFPLSTLAAFFLAPIFASVFYFFSKQLQKPDFHHDTLHRFSFHKFLHETVLRYGMDEVE